VVSGGGRPYFAGDSLHEVHAPTLLIVGGRDEMVLKLNRQAQPAIPAECEVAVVPGATHLFEDSSIMAASHAKPLAPRAAVPDSGFRDRRGIKVCSVVQTRNRLVGTGLNIA
jgi:hypothetical protein